MLIAGGTKGVGLSFLREALSDDSFGRIYVLGRDFDRGDFPEDKRIVRIRCDITDKDSTDIALKMIDRKISSLVNAIEVPKTYFFGSDKDQFLSSDTSNIRFTMKVIDMLDPEFGQIVVYSTNGTYNVCKSAYMSYLDFTRRVNKNVRITKVIPQRDIEAIRFQVAKIMMFALKQPKKICIPEILVNNKP
jgi:hypothetical protein